MSADPSIIVSLISLATAVGVGWYGARANREIESIKVQLDRSRLSFQTEHQILSEIWRAAASFERATVGLRPDMEVLKPGESDGVRKKRKIDEFQSARTHLVATFMTSRPFYPGEIVSALRPIIEVADQEWWDTLLWGESCVDTPDPENAIEAKLDRLASLSGSMDALCETIRARVSP